MSKTLKVLRTVPRERMAIIKIHDIHQNIVQVTKSSIVAVPQVSPLLV